MKDYKKEVVKILQERDLGLSSEEIENLIEIPPKEDLGDYSFPCFQLAKTLRKNPKLIAEDLAGEIESPDFEKVVSVGPYLNFYINRKNFQNEVLEEILEKKETYGSSDLGQGKNIIIEFSSPNIAKPFHIGHIRSTVIGDAIRNIFDFLGYNTTAINYIGDYGTQFGVMIAAYKLWGDDKKIEEEGIKELLNLYVRYNREAEEKPEMMDEARDEFNRLENEDPEAVRVWKWFREVSLREFDRVYGLLDIDFDNYQGESYNSKGIPAVIEELKEKNLLQESEGAQIVDLSSYDLTPVIVIKSNGSSNYITRDIATAINRKKEFNFDENIYVVASQQNLHFNQLRTVLKLMGYDRYESCLHIPFGMVSLKDQTLSTRKGHVVYLEDVLNKSIARTREIMEERKADLDDLDETARIVGIGAVKFQELYNNRIKDYVFDWDELLNFEGETGPYVQYTYARAKSVLRRAGVSEDSFDGIAFEKLNEDVEFSLVKALFSFKGAILKAREKYEPSLVTRQVMEVAKAYNKFYNSCQIMVEDQKLREERLALSYATSIVIKNGLGLLGIKTVEKM